VGDGHPGRIADGGLRGGEPLTCDAHITFLIACP
jgi:hypothetical protein